MVCTRCGNEISDLEQNCTKCGESVMSHEDQKPRYDIEDFKKFVDNHVRTTTKYQSAEDLLNRCKPLSFIWVSFGVSFVIGSILAPPYGGFFFLILGYAAAFIASGIIRSQYRSKYRGEFIGDINTDDLVAFLNEHLKHIHPWFHKWGYLTKTGLLPILENAISHAAKEVRICGEFGPKRKSLLVFYMRPKMIDGKTGENKYYIDAQKNGFTMDGRAAGFLAHGSLIRAAPILHAVMEFYLKSKP